MENTDTDEEILAAMKEKGFTRVGPHTQSTRKQAFTSITCKICQQTFKTEADLKLHIKTHDTDGDWNCHGCSFQTNSEYNLKKHTDIANHQTNKAENSGVRCNLCDKRFETADNVATHKRNTHKSFKPCTNLPDCPYESECMFNHNFRSCFNISVTFIFHTKCFISLYLNFFLMNPVYLINTKEFHEKTFCRRNFTAEPRRSWIVAIQQKLLSNLRVT